MNDRPTCSAQNFLAARRFEGREPARARPQDPHPGARAGRILFKEGDTDKRTFYLVAGNVELRADDRLVGMIRAGSPEARAALAPACRENSPRAPPATSNTS